MGGPPAVREGDVGGSCWGIRGSESVSADLKTMRAVRIDSAEDLAQSCTQEEIGIRVPVLGIEKKSRPAFIPPVVPSQESRGSTIGQLPNFILRSATPTTGKALQSEYTFDLPTFPSDSDPNQDS